MGDTRLYSSAYYRQQLADYRAQWGLTFVTNDEVQRARLLRWIVTTEQYIIDAKKAGL
jgi:hypothetical protein